MPSNYMSTKSRRSEGYNLSPAAKRSTMEEDNNNDNDFYQQLYRTWERLEFYLFLFGGSYSWYYVVFKVLDWHRFPVHLYTFELWMVVLVPIILILIMLYVMDHLFHVKEDKPAT
mmetsp:Transcript_21031/g.42292  ORF Transcript_21031/g.42292 Transcript_21031/m.42292 type:complete len:115 (+) Transcript_21031:105-449(+)